MICPIELNIENPIKIGKGAHNTVYAVQLPEYGEVAVRECRDFRSMEDTYRKWKALREAGLPTTSFMIKATWNEKYCIITELLNKETYCYISPNTLRGNYFQCELESCFMNNKIVGLVNLDDFWVKVRKDLKIAADRGLFLFADSYFFKMQRHAEWIDTDYVIADWDNVEIYEDKETLFQANWSNFLDACYDFTKVVKEGSWRDEFIKRIYAELRAIKV